MTIRVDLLGLLLAQGKLAEAEALLDRWVERIDHELAEARAERERHRGEHEA